LKQLLAPDDPLPQLRREKTPVLTLAPHRQVIVSGSKRTRIERRLAGRVSDELWHRKSGDWEAELPSIRRETARHERASHDYGAMGSNILELAKNAHNCSVGRIRTNRRDS
jgi:hypothetical protein